MTSQMEHLITTGDLIAELAARAPKIGGNDGGWPGLTIYRFHEPMAPTWEEIQTLSIGIVAQGRKVVMVEGSNYVYDPSTTSSSAATFTSRRRSSKQARAGPSSPLS